jgi:aconitate hydratase
MFLGVKAVLAKSIERIHAANLINFGILPLIFKDEKDYDGLSTGDEIEIPDVRKLLSGKSDLKVVNQSKRKTFEVSCDLTDRQKQIVLAGGVLNMIK